MKKTKSPPPPKPGHADTLKPRLNKAENEEEAPRDSGPIHSEMLDSVSGSSRTLPSGARNTVADGEANGRSDGSSISSHSTDSSSGNDGGGQPKPPKILMEDPSATPLELRSQIQLYATNE